MGEKEESPLNRTAFQRAAYRFGQLFFRTLFRIAWRSRILGAETIPPTGPLLFAANHASFVDPPLVGSSMRRPIYFMAKEELFRIPIFGWLISQVNAFPIRRKAGDIGAFRTAQRILAEGGALIMFPEGKRQKGGRFGPAKAGVGLLANTTGTPVVPVYLHNTYKIMRLPTFTVIFGPPLSAAAQESALAFSERIMRSIRQLKEAKFGPAA